MATNKHATIRYQVLDRCFKNTGRKYSMDDLVLECNKALNEYTGAKTSVMRRQVYEDIKFMESSQGWSIALERVRDGHKVLYRYEDRSFSINSQPLNQTEQKQLKEALLTLSRFKGMPQFEWVDELSARLDSGLGLSQHTGPVIEFEQNKYLKGLDHITPAYNAIVHARALKILYQSFKQEAPDEFIFYPYFLKQFNNRWFLFGKREGVDSLVNLALDRIQQIEESSKKFIPNKSIDFSEYFEDVIGVTVRAETDAEKLLLKISSSVWPYIESKPLHGSQKVKSRSGSDVVVELNVQVNHELIALLFSYMDTIEIIDPKALRERIKDISKAIYSKYI